jgi:hypothetical protein
MMDILTPDFLTLRPFELPMCTISEGEDDAKEVISEMKVVPIGKKASMLYEYQVE